MKKENLTNVHIVCMTKGGVGKSTFTSPLSTMLYLNNPEKKINIFELDDFNEAQKVKSSFINHQTLKLKSTEMADETELFYTPVSKVVLFATLLVSVSDLHKGLSSFVFPVKQITQNPLG